MAATTVQVRGARGRRRALAGLCFLAVFVLPVTPAPLRAGAPTAVGPEPGAHAGVAGATGGDRAASASGAEGPGTEVLAATMERPAEVAVAAPPVTEVPATLPPPVDTVPTVGTVAPEAPPTTDVAPAPPPPVTVAPPPVVAPPLARAVEGLSSAERRDVASQALGLIAYDWQGSLPGWEIRFLDARAGYRGLTYPEDRVVEVYVRPSDSPTSLAHVVAHELGHAVDVTWFGAAQRGEWLAARAVDPRVTWFVEAGGSDFASGAGDFAESFAWWQVGGPTWFGELAPPPSEEQLAVLARLVLQG